MCTHRQTLTHTYVHMHLYTHIHVVTLMFLYNYIHLDKPKLELPQSLRVCELIAALERMPEVCLVGWWLVDTALSVWAL